MSISECPFREFLSRPKKEPTTNNYRRNKFKVEGAAHNTKKLWLINPKKPTFAAPTPGLERDYFKFESSQYAARFMETKDNLENYAAVSYNTQ